MQEKFCFFEDFDEKTCYFFAVFIFLVEYLLNIGYFWVFDEILISFLVIFSFLMEFLLNILCFSPFLRNIFVFLGFFIDFAQKFLCLLALEKKKVFGFLWLFLAFTIPIFTLIQVSLFFTQARKRRCNFMMK